MIDCCPVRNECGYAFVCETPNSYHVCNDFYDILHTKTFLVDDLVEEYRQRAESVSYELPEGC
ncbi:MAG: hypothetical protein R3250_16875 [Melioribacteraceae bacterium]|nr:hypothetical protein [Melioribacteraceae bacterium]